MAVKYKESNKLVIQMYEFLYDFLPLEDIRQSSMRILYLYSGGAWQLSDKRFWHRLGLPQEYTTCRHTG